MSKFGKYPGSFRLRLLFAFFVFIAMFVTMALMLLGMFVIVRFDLVGEREIHCLPFLMFAAASIIVGTVISLIVGRRPLAPLTDIMEAVDKITEGDYSVRVKPQGPEQFCRLGEKFNEMAAELDNVEIMRSDFIGSFSHEFKTPIVSIRGFAKALKWDSLTEEERDEYLDIIINESERLSDLSVNVLYLSKIEKQNILTGRTTFNVCEQIRQVVALLDNKLTSKNLEFAMEGDETFVSGNEEMLRQVWINLMDNAIKFSPERGRINVNINASGDSEAVVVSVANQGKEIPEDVMKHIFDKFYQGDASHNTSGNGLGLAIVRKIIDLHNGKITVTSSEKGSVFEVTLNV